MDKCFACKQGSLHFNPQHMYESGGGANHSLILGVRDRWILGAHQSSSLAQTCKTFSLLKDLVSREEEEQQRTTSVHYLGPSMHTYGHTHPPICIPISPYTKL